MCLSVYINDYKAYKKNLFKGKTEVELFKILKFNDEGEHFSPFYNNEWSLGYNTSDFDGTCQIDCSVLMFTKGIHVFNSFEDATRSGLMITRLCSHPKEKIIKVRCSKYDFIGANTNESVFTRVWVDSFEAVKG